MCVKWKVWTTAKSEQAATRVLRRLETELDVPLLSISMETYYKTGLYLLRFKVELSGSSWEEYVVESIELGQKVGYEWSLSGDVSSDPGALSHKSRVTGVEMMEWTLSSQGDGAVPDP